MKICCKASALIGLSAYYQRKCINNTPNITDYLFPFQLKPKHLISSCGRHKYLILWIEQRFEQAQFVFCVALFRQYGWDSSKDLFRPNLNVVISDIEMNTSFDQSSRRTINSKSINHTMLAIMSPDELGGVDLHISHTRRRTISNFCPIN